MTTPIVPIVIIGGIAYTLAQSSGDDAPPPTTGPVRDPINLANLNASHPHLISASQLIKKFGATGPAFTSPANMAPDPEQQKKLDEIEAAARKAYDDMEDVAKVEAIDKLNQNLGTDLPLDADLSWETISMAAYSAAGAAAGAYVCGPVCAKVGALAAAYLGVELNKLMEKTYDEVKAWAEEEFGDLVGGEMGITSYTNAYNAWKQKRKALGLSDSSSEFNAWAKANGHDVFSSKLDDDVISGVVPV